MSKQKTDSESMSLQNAPQGIPLEIVTIDGGTQMLQKLSAMGLTYHTVVKVVRGGGGGPMVVQVRGSKVGLGRGISRKIIVRPFFADKIREV